MHILHVTEIQKTNRGSKCGTCRAWLFALFQVVFSLQVGFLASLEGYTIEVRPATLAMDNTTVSLQVK